MLYPFPFGLSAGVGEHTSSRGCYPSPPPLSLPLFRPRMVHSASMQKLLVISGPSGVGKSTLLKRLFERHPGVFGFSVSHTTRSPRPGEQAGQDYHFVTRDEFQRLIDQREFLEWAEFSRNLYGTSTKAVQSVLDAGKRCILDIDLQGVKSVKKAGSHLNPFYIFIRPPNFEVLRSRLQLRNTECDDSLALRLKAAQADTRYAEENPDLYDLVIVNDDVDRAYQQLESSLFG